jgi:hypothetical protein
MRRYLSRSISSINANKLNGILAEIDFRHYLQSQGFSGRVSMGGWIARRVGDGEFARNTAVFFPEIIRPNCAYPPNRNLPSPDNGLHTICATFHQTGISAYYCCATIDDTGSLFGDSGEVVWQSVQLGLPTQQAYAPLLASVNPLFTERTRRFSYLRKSNKTNTSKIRGQALAEEFSKENLRIAFQTKYMAEVSDVDGIFWGQQNTYPLEIKEKTAAFDKRVGFYFGLDVGPFVKLAYYAARRGNLNSLFVVREIESVQSRTLRNWWYITFEQLAKYASWFPMKGGTSMTGGASSVVCIPRSLAVRA